METPKTQQQKQQQQQPQSQNYNKSKEGTGITTTAAAAQKPLNKALLPTKKSTEKNHRKKTQPNPITEMYHHNSKDFSHEFVEQSKSGAIPKPEFPPPHLLWSCTARSLLPMQLGKAVSCTFLLHSFGVSFRSFHPMDNLDRPKYKLDHPMAYIHLTKWLISNFMGLGLNGLFVPL
jgi:hypothetical protein